MIKLGSLQLTTDLILAPLMDVTTPSFRQLILNQGGVGLIVTPMVFVQQIAKAPKTVLPHMEGIEKQRPSSVQIISNGKNEEYVKIALDILSSFKFDLIDLNVGCPARHTMNSGGGGAFLKEYHQTQSLKRLENVVKWSLKYSPVPVSLKTRLGFTNTTDMLEICPLFEKWGIDFLTIHGRTIDQKYRGDIDLQKIREIKEKLNIPVIGNGNILSYADYHKMKEETGVDAVMIGRGAMQNPRIFAQIEEAKQAASKEDPIPIYPEHYTLSAIRDFISQNDAFIEQSSRFWNSDRFRRAEMRRLAIWLIKGIPGYKIVRQKLSQLHDLALLKKYIFSEQIELDFKQQPENLSDLKTSSTSVSQKSGY